MFDCLGGAADVAPAEAVASPSVPGADVAALGVDGSKSVGFAEPVGADAEGFVNTCAGYS